MYGIRSGCHKAQQGWQCWTLAIDRIRVGGGGGGAGNSTHKSDTVEDIRPQLLRHEPIQLTPPNSGESKVAKQQPGNRVAEKKSVNIAIQIELTSEDLNVLQKIDNKLPFMYAQTTEAVRAM